MIQKLGQIFRFFSARYPHFVLNEVESGKGSTVAMVVATRAHFYPRLYSDASLTYPIEIKGQISGIGQKTVALVRTLRHKVSKGLLFGGEVVLANVDQISHKAVPFDEEFIDKCSKILWW